MSAVFEPRNELEKSLLAARAEKISDVGFDMEPETVNELVDSLGQKACH